MQELDLAAKILDDIIDEGTPFGEALRKVFQPNQELRPLRATVSGLVGCELRHHLMFEYIMEADEYKDWEMPAKRLAYLSLADLYYFKRISPEDIKAHLAQAIGEEKVAALEPLFAKAGNPKEYLPELPRDLQLSLRFNVPEWVLKVWRHFGNGKMYNIAKANSRPAKFYVRVRTSMISAEAILSSGEDFEKTPVEDVLLYKGKTPLRKVELYRKGMIFDIKPATKLISDTFKIEDPKQGLLYLSARDHSMIEEWIETYGPRVAMNIGVKDVSKYPDVTRLIKAENLKNVNFFGAEPDAMEAAISKPQDLVFCVPASSSFDNIRETPDFLLHFSTEELDQAYDEQKKALEGCSKYVAEGGTLVYIIYTISRKEGHNTVKAFLENHPEFQLVEEKQGFPFEELDTSYYYCAMKKDSSLAKAEPPLIDPAMIPSEEAPQAQAEGK